MLHGAVDFEKIGLFDSKWYAERYAEEIPDGTEPLEHYLTADIALTNQPNPNFDVKRYLADHPYLVHTQQSPLQHYYERYYLRLYRSRKVSRSLSPRQLLLWRKFYAAVAPPSSPLDKFYYYSKRLLQMLSDKDLALIRSKILARLFPNRIEEYNPDPVWGITSRGKYMRFAAHDKSLQKFIDIFEPTDEELEIQTRLSRQWEDRPFLSVVTPTYNTPIDVLSLAMKSVLQQTYENWEWIIVDGSTTDEVWKYLSEEASKDDRIRLTRLDKNLGISGNTNIALRQTCGDFVVMLDHDDCYAPDALYEIACVVRDYTEVDLIYSDEDKLLPELYRARPLFKPDFSPEMMLNANLITHIFAFRRKLLDTVGYLNPETDGAQDWDMCLRISEVTKQIYHIPKILYHWRIVVGSTAGDPNAKSVRPAQKNAIESHLRRKGINNPKAHFIESDPVHSVHCLVRWQSLDDRKISVVIPSKNQIELCRRCLKSLFNLTDYDAYEVVLVDTGSKPEAFEMYKDFEHQTNFRVVRFEEEKFNFSRACNYGAQHTDGELLLFLNNDVEILHADWLERMAQWFDIREVGMVGAKLLYPDLPIVQHAGVLLGLGGLAGHAYYEIPEKDNTISGHSGLYRNFLSVTGACQMILRTVFDRIGGFNEDYQLICSDIELGVTTYELGYRVVYTPDVRLIHHESVSRGRNKVPRRDFDVAFTNLEKWLERGDPFYNPNLSILSEGSDTVRQYYEDTPHFICKKLKSYLREQYYEGNTLDLNAIPDRAAFLPPWY